jgi:hypothetical protein
MAIDRSQLGGWKVTWAKMGQGISRQVNVASAGKNRIFMVHLWVLEPRIDNKPFCHDKSFAGKDSVRGQGGRSAGL